MVREELVRLRRERVSEEELARARSYLVGSFPLRMDTAAEVSDLLVAIERFDLGLDYPARFRQAVSARHRRRRAPRGADPLGSGRHESRAGGQPPRGRHREPVTWRTSAWSATSSGALEQGLEAQQIAEALGEHGAGRMAGPGSGDVGGAVRARGLVRVSPARDRRRPEPGDAAQDRGVRQLPLRRDAGDQRQSRRRRSRPHPSLRVPEPPPDRDGAPAPDDERGHRHRAPAEAPRAPPVGPGPAAAPSPGPRGRLLLPDHRRARGPRRGAGGRGLPEAERRGCWSESSRRARRSRRCAGASARSARCCRTS